MLQPSPRRRLREPQARGAAGGRPGADRHREYRLPDAPPGAAARCRCGTGSSCSTRILHEAGTRRLPARLPGHLRHAGDAWRTASRVKIQGDPTHAVHRRHAVHQGRALPRAHVLAGPAAPSDEAGRAKGQRRIPRITWDEALDEIAARLKALAAEDPQTILPLQLRRHDGHAAVQLDGPALLPPARRLAARPHAVLLGRQGRASRRRSAAATAWTPSASTSRS